MCVVHQLQYFSHLYAFCHLKLILQAETRCTTLLGGAEVVDQIEHHNPQVALKLPPGLSLLQASGCVRNAMCVCVCVSVCACAKGVVTKRQWVGFFCDKSIGDISECALPRCRHQLSGHPSHSKGYWHISEICQCMFKVQID